MKDSHVGSYAVLGLLLYYLTYWALGTSLPAGWIPAVLFASDITGKVTSLLQVQFLPYARREEDSKIGVTYRKARPFAIYAALAIFLTAQWWALRPIEATPIGGSELAHFVPLSIFLPILVGGGSSPTCVSVSTATRATPAERCASSQSWRRSRASPSSTASA